MKIGDKIKVTDPGDIYSSYKNMAEMLGADVGNKWIVRGIIEGSETKGKEGHILNISKDGHILIELDNSQQWLIAKAGLKKIDIILSEELFEI